MATQPFRHRITVKRHQRIAEYPRNIGGRPQVWKLSAAIAQHNPVRSEISVSDLIRSCVPTSLLRHGVRTGARAFVSLHMPRIKRAKLRETPLIGGSGNRISHEPRRFNRLIQKTHLTTELE